MLHCQILSSLFISISSLPFTWFPFMPDFLYSAWVNILTSLPSWTPEYRTWLAPVISIILGILVGIIVEKLVLGILRSILRHTSIALNNEIAQTLRGFILWLFSLWGILMAADIVEGVSEKVIGIVHKTILVIVMLILIRLTARIAVALIRFYMNRTRELQALPSTSIFENIIRVLVYLFGFIMLLQTVGIAVAPLLTALGVGGLAISLALQDTLANMFSGINMILSRQIRIGTYVTLEGKQEGTIQDIGWRNTTLKNPVTNNIIILPNIKMATNIITNMPIPPDNTIPLSFNLTYDTDLLKAEKICQDLASEVLEKLEGKAPTTKSAIRYNSFNDIGIRLNVTLIARLGTDGDLVRHEYIKALYERFLQENIEIAFVHTPLPVTSILAK
jgi:small-conductance mechanosensitive channel